MDSPTPLRWCASCDRFVRPAAHLDFHEGKTIDEARSPGALLELRRTKVPPIHLVQPPASGRSAVSHRTPVWMNQPKRAS